MSYSLSQGYVGEGQIEEKQLILAIPPANAVPQLERAWLNRRGQWQFNLVIQVAFYLAGVTDPMEDRVKGFQPNQPISPPTLPSHTTDPPRPVTRSNPPGRVPSTHWVLPTSEHTQQLPSPIQAIALCICNLQLNYILHFNISQLCSSSNCCVAVF